MEEFVLKENKENSNQDKPKTNESIMTLCLDWVEKRILKENNNPTLIL